MFRLFFFKQKTAYEMRISDWSSDVCSSDLQRIDDLDLDVGNDPHFAETDPLHVEPGRDLRHILVLRAARENLVADHQHGGGPDAFVAHHLALARWHDKTSPLAVEERS